MVGSYKHSRCKHTCEETQQPEGRGREGKETQGAGTGREARRAAGTQSYSRRPSCSPSAPTRDA
jgi:hypothetical protein